MLTYIQVKRERSTGGKADRQVSRQTGGQSAWQTDRPMDRGADKQVLTGVPGHPFSPMSPGSPFNHNVIDTLLII